MRQSCYVAVIMELQRFDCHQTEGLKLGQWGLKAVGSLGIRVGAKKLERAALDAVNSMVSEEGKVRIEQNHL